MNLDSIIIYFENRKLFFTEKQLEILHFYFEKKPDLSFQISKLLFDTYSVQSEDKVMFYPSNFFWKFLEMIGTKGEDYLKLEITKKYMEDLLKYG